jgi:hypothetical protein
MRKSHLFLIPLLFILTSCNFTNRRNEPNDNTQSALNKEINEQIIQDSINFNEAVKLYNEEKWEDALKLFLNIYTSNYYENKSKVFIDKIQNKPWNKTIEGIKETSKGKFSNSATKDSPLWVEFLINKKGDIYLYMYEYSSSKPINRSAVKPSYNFSLYVSGYKSEFLCYEIRPKDSYVVSEATHSEGIRISGSLAEDVINTLKKSKDKVYFSITMGSSSTYNFYLNSVGFSKAYSSL